MLEKAGLTGGWHEDGLREALGQTATLPSGTFIGREAGRVGGKGTGVPRGCAELQVSWGHPWGAMSEAWFPDNCPWEEDAESTGRPSGSYGQCWGGPWACAIKGCGSQPTLKAFSVATALGKNESGQGEGILFLLRPCLCAPVPTVTRLVLKVTPGASFLGVHKNVSRNKRSAQLHLHTAGPAAIKLGPAQLGLCVFTLSHLPCEMS